MPTKHALVIVLFLAALWTPLIGMMIGRSRAGVHDENRELAKLPQLALSPRGVLALPWEFNRYFHDHFGFRGSLIILQSLLKVKLLGVSSSPSVIVGRHGWLYFTGDLALENCCEVLPAGGEKIGKWVAVLRGRQQWLARKGIQFSLAIAPDKLTVYPQNLPASIHPNGRPSQFDLLADALRLQTSVHLIDLRPALATAAQQSPRPLYSLTDTHWNTCGAFVAYRSIVADLAKIYPDLPPAAQPSDRTEGSFEGSGDLANMLGLRREIHERMFTCDLRPPPYPIRHIVDTEKLLIAEQSAVPPRRLLMLRDSFGAALEPFLERHFTRSAFSLSDRLQPDLVESEHPDVVILEMAERRLNTDPPTN